MSLKSVVAGVIFSVLFSVQIYASSGHYVRTNADGLSSSSISSITQDSLGRLWVGTWDGLNVYDSNEFWIWQSEADNPNSLSNNIIRKIYEQKEGIMWVCTDYGINRIEAQTGRIDKFFPGYESRRPTEENQFMLSVSEDGKVFCGARDWGIAFYDEDAGRMEAVNIPGLSTADITGIYCMGKDRIMLHSRHGKVSVIRYGFTEPGKISVSDKPDVLAPTGVIFISECPDAVYMVSEDNSLMRYDVQEDTVDYKVHVPHGNEITAIAGIGEREIAIGFASDGVCRLDIASGKITEEPETDGMSILSLYYGSQDILWAGTDGQGLWALYDDPFKMYKMTYMQMSGAAVPRPVRAFYKDKEGRLYAATKGDGIFIVRDGKPAGVIDVSDGLDNNSVYALAEGYSDDIFVGHAGIGFNVISQKTGNVSSVMPAGGEHFGSVYCFLKDIDNGCLWLGTYGYGMVRLELGYDGSRYTVRRQKIYRNDRLDSASISNNIVQSIVAESDSVLWVATRGGGLNRFSIRTGKFTHFTMDDGRRPISSDEILCLLYGKDSTLWIGTGFGLNRMERDEDGEYGFRSFTTRGELHNNTVHGIEEDDSGNLWLSTNHGLSVLNAATGKATNFFDDDKLQNNEYSDGASYRDSDGMIYFGGINGYNWFNPSDVSLRDFEAEVIISRVTLAENPKADIMDGTGKVVLRHDDNFFDVHFTAMEYINNSNCEYSYRLDGFNSGWMDIGPEHTASFTNVPPGKYLFMVRCTNGDKVWSDRVSTMEIRVLPPWWKTVWAYIAYVLAVAAMAYSIQRAVSYRIAERHRLEIEELKRKQMTETYEAKLGFFTNIAHEFTTPLTLICGPVEQLLSGFSFPPKIERYLRIVRSNSERMLRLLRELIEFRKADTGMEKLEYSKVNMSEMMLTVMDNFSEMNEEKQINLTLDIGQDIRLVTDRNAVEKVVYNLVSNAYKYTPDGGEITVGAALDPSGKFMMTVRNSGKGIRPEQLGKVFDRFVVLDNYENQAKSGKIMRNGIGMALAYSLVKSLEGDLTVSSEPGKFTVFTLSIPDAGEDKIGGGALADGSPVFPDPVSAGIPDIVPRRPVEAEIHERTKVQVPDRDVMIVDDEPQIRELVSDILGHDFRVIQAGDGKEALAELANGIPDLIITDLNMPGMDGMELLRNLKGNEITRSVPVIFLAFKTDIGEEIESYETGSEVFIPKPFYPDHLRAVVHRILDNRSMLKDYYNSAVSSTDIYDGTVVDNDDKEFIVKMTGLVEQNLSDEGLSPDWLCEKMLLSRTQLYRKIKELTRMTPSEFIRSVKLKHAEHLLRTTRLTVQEIMYSSGFNSKSYFFREFAARYHMSPKEYRKGLKMT